jgi:hypothetical protein
VKWIDALWDELERMDPVDQVVFTGEAITQITREVLPALGRHRRVAVVNILAKEGWDPGLLADSIGSRTSTIKRLAEEGRSILKSERDHR